MPFAVVVSTDGGRDGSQPFAITLRRGGHEAGSPSPWLLKALGITAVCLEAGPHARREVGAV